MKVTIEQLEAMAAAVPVTIDVPAFVRIVRTASEQFAPAAEQFKLRPRRRCAQPVSEPAIVVELQAGAPLAPAAPVAARPDALAGGAAPALRSGLDWTAAEEASLRDLHAQGVPVRDIAERLGRPYEATRKRLLRSAKGLTPPAKDRDAPGDYRHRKDGWTPAEIQRIHALRAEGQSFRQIGAELGRDSDAVRKAFRRDVPAQQDVVKVVPPIRADVWTDEADDLLATRWVAGESLGQIAAKLGRTVKACQVRLTRLRATGMFDRLRQRRAPVPFAVQAAPAAAAAAPASSAVDEEISAPAPPLAPLASCECPPMPAQVPALDAEAADVGGDADLPVPCSASGSAPAASTSLPLAALAVTKSADGEYLTPPEGLTGLQRDVWRHLARLDGEDFTPADDLYLAESLVARVPMEVICDALSCDSKGALGRFSQMKFPAILTDRKHLSIDGQAALLSVLKLRAAVGG